MCVCVCVCCVAAENRSHKNRRDRRAKPGTVSARIFGAAHPRTCPCASDSPIDQQNTSAHSTRWFSIRFIPLRRFTPIFFVMFRFTVVLVATAALVALLVVAQPPSPTTCARGTFNPIAFPPVTCNPPYIPSGPAPFPQSNAFRTATYPNLYDPTRYGSTALDIDDTWQEATPFNATGVSARQLQGFNGFLKTEFAWPPKKDKNYIEYHGLDNTSSLIFLPMIPNTHALRHRSLTFTLQKHDGVQWIDVDSATNSPDVNSVEQKTRATIDVDQIRPLPYDFSMAIAATKKHSSLANPVFNTSQLIVPTGFDLNCLTSFCVWAAQPNTIYYPVQEGDGPFRVIVEYDGVVGGDYFGLRAADQPCDIVSHFCQTEVEKAEIRVAQHYVGVKNFHNAIELWL